MNQISYFQHIVNSHATYKEVRLIEVARDIPANLAILSSFLHHSMEES